MKRKIVLLAGLLGLVCSVPKVQAQASDPDTGGKNMVKFNVLTLIGGKFSLEYERMLTKRISVGTAISLRPDKGLPFASTVKDLVDDEELNSVLDGLTTSNFSITPEARFYVSKKGLFRGFYLAPYVKYATYKMALPYEFDVEVDGGGATVYDRTETIPLKGDVKTFTGGLSFGVNFKLAKNVHLDWRIIGPGYGGSSGNISGRMKLDADEQQFLRDNLADLKESLTDLPVKINMDYTVNGEGAEVEIKKSPWAAIRSGLSIGYRF